MIDDDISSYKLFFIGVFVTNNHFLHLNMSEGYFDCIFSSIIFVLKILIDAYVEISIVRYMNFFIASLKGIDCQQYLLSRTLR